MIAGEWAKLPRILEIAYGYAGMAFKAISFMGK